MQMRMEMVHVLSKNDGDGLRAKAGYKAYPTSWLEPIFTGLCCMSRVAAVNRVIVSHSKATFQMQMQLDQRLHVGDASGSRKGVCHFGSWQGPA